MLGFENNLVMSKVINDNLKKEMDCEFSLSRMEESTGPSKKDRSGIKAAVMACVVVICVGFCFVSPSHSTKNSAVNNNYSMQI